jgi:hypothetical protein
VVNSFLRRLGIWVHGSRYGVSRSRTTDCPSERHVNAKGSHRRQQSTSAARSLSSGALIQKIPGRVEEENGLAANRPIDALSYSSPDRFERTSLSDFESRGPPDTASTTGRS